MAKSSVSKVRKPRITDDTNFGGCPSYHLLTKFDRVCKMGNTTWTFTPEQFVGMRAKHVYDSGYHVQKAK